MSRQLIYLHSFLHHYRWRSRIKLRLDQGKRRHDENSVKVKEKSLYIRMIMQMEGIICMQMEGIFLFMYADGGNHGTKLVGNLRSGFNLKQILLNERYENSSTRKLTTKRLRSCSHNAGNRNRLNKVFCNRYIIEEKLYLSREVYQLLVIKLGQL